MESVSLVGHSLDPFRLDANFFLQVFSAPKYCDSTENKGAYINIGPELKLEYKQFDAVPHPDIKPMVRRSNIGANKK